MKEILDDIERWRKAGKRVALARVVALDGSGPLDPGATMPVNENGEVAGSVSGGCVEAAVVIEALAALDDGIPRRCQLGYSDDDSFAVGLSCGGTIHVLIEPHLPMVYDEFEQALRADCPVALATVADLDNASNTEGPALSSSMLVLADGRREGSLGNEELDVVVGRDATGTIANGLNTCGRSHGR